MPNEIKFVLREGEFRKWLESRDPNENVGYRQSTTSCPLVTYIVDRVNLPGKPVHYVEVTETRYKINGRSVYFKPGSWPMQFVERVDTEGEDRDSCSAKEALEILG